MRLKTLILKNFQSHEETALEFSPNFNCIIGASNVGKTAVFNALAFLFLNEWDSDFLRHGSDKCSIAMTTDTNDEYVRTKSKSVNSISIKENGVVKKYENFGTEYPKELQDKFTGMVDEIAVCFGYQDHNSFLIHEAPAVKGKTLMHLSGVGILDKAALEISSVDKELRLDIQALEKQKQTLTNDLAKFAEIDKLDKLIDKHAGLAEKYDKWVGQYNAVVDIYERMQKNNAQIQDTANALNHISLDVDAEIKFLERIRAIKSLRDKFAFNNDNILRLEKTVADSAAALNDYLAQLVDALGRAKQCPMCGGELSSHSVDYIFKEFGL